MRVFANICSSDLEQSKQFYIELLGLEVKFESDWYIQLCAPGQEGVEYGLIKRDHPLVPQAYQQAPTGMYMTFVVPNVDEIYRKAQDVGFCIVQAPKNEFYGQRRLLVKDRDGCLLDISSPYSQTASES